MNHLLAKRRELVEGLGQTAKHGFTSLCRRLTPRTFALREPLGERISFERRETRFERFALLFIAFRGRRSG
jgi:hypothetical protein